MNSKSLQGLKLLFPVPGLTSLRILNDEPASILGSYIVDLSIVVPIYNEEESINALCAISRKLFPEQVSITS